MNAPKGPAEVLRKSPERTRPCHATSPCLANTRRFLRLLSLPVTVQTIAGVLHSSGTDPQSARENSKRIGAGAANDLAARNRLNYLRILATTPAPTVRPPSRIAKRRPSSIATGLINDTTIFTLSPGITISTPSGSWQAPVMSVVRK